MPQIANETTRSDERQPCRRAEELAHRVDEQPDHASATISGIAIDRKNGGCQRRNTTSRDEQQRERDERQQQPVDAAEAEAHDLRVRRGLEAHAAIEHPADAKASGDDRELDPAGRRRQRGRDAR